jgi:hypothetical protein
MGTRKLHGNDIKAYTFSNIGLWERWTRGYLSFFLLIDPFRIQCLPSVLGMLKSYYGNMAIR